MATSIYILPNHIISPTTISTYLSAYFKTNVVSVEYKSTFYCQNVYFVVFATPIPPKKVETMLQHGEYRFWPEPSLLLRIYLTDPTTLEPTQHFTTRQKYIVATGEEYKQTLTNEKYPTTVYLFNKETDCWEETTESPFTF